MPTQCLEVKAFTDPSGEGGNSAGVVLGAQGLSQLKRQMIAKELKFSETAFHSVSSTGEESLEFFTPNRAIDFCGHATVATYGALLSSVGASIFGEKRVQMRGGPRRVRIQQDRISLETELKSIRPASFDLKAMVAKTFENPNLNLETIDIVDNGVRFLVVQVKSAQILQSLMPRFKEIIRLSESLNAIGYYVFTPSTSTTYLARMFAPAYGIPEESATGMGASALGFVLRQRLREMRFIVQQGQWMGQPSVLNFESIEMNGPGAWIGGGFRIIREISLKGDTKS